jgi:hypothetical protein
MTTPPSDDRSPTRRARDEEIAAEPRLAPPALPDSAEPLPIEHHLAHVRRPFAVAGRVENGVVKPLDPAVTLPEHARVIIIATEQQDHES